MLNKKLLAAAIVGTLAAGNAAAANLSTSPVTPAYFAKEIVIGTNGTQLTTSVPAAQLTWNIGYNFSQGEVRYARLECSNTIKFDAATVITLSDAAAGNVGSINGLNTNTLTFSITSVGGPANNVIAADTLLVSGNHTITSTANPVNCSVALYDQPSQAQAGGSTGLITNTYFTGPYLAFAQSYELLAGPTVHVADVEADPSFTEFLPDAFTNIDEAFIGSDGGVAFQLRDPDGTTGAQTATFGVNGLPITLPALFAAGTTITATGDFTPVSNADGSFTGAALTRVELNGFAANQLTATSARFPVGNAGFTGSDVSFWNQLGKVMQESKYNLTLNPVAAAPTVYAVTPISNVYAGEIVRNGTVLQAPLVNVPGGWFSRLILTNTGSLDRDYEITVQGEDGNTISTANLTGVVKAGKTLVIDDLKTVLTGFSGAPRATLVVTVAGPDKQIQGLYQIVNPDKGSISNHVLVRPGTN